MKLLTGKLDNQYDPQFRLSYALTITPACERSKMVDGKRWTPNYHRAVMTVADSCGDVINMFERDYELHPGGEKTTGELTDRRIKWIRRDLRGIAKRAC